MTLAAEIQYVVAGVECMDNLRIYEAVVKAYGRDSAKRILELSHLMEFLPKVTPTRPTVVCLDVLNYDLEEVTTVVGQIRDIHPTVVFLLYVDKNEYSKRKNDFPGDWANRFNHYYWIYKEDNDIEISPIVRASLRPAQEEAISNMGGNPVRLTKSYEKGIIKPYAENPNLTKTVFVSYSRFDWDGFVMDLVENLSASSHKVWVDQEYIVGGEDWLDAVGCALQECDTLLLVLSPEAVNSKYVKMEYRYFFNQEKPIIPVLYKKTDIPFELATLHFLDFSGVSFRPKYWELMDILSRERNG